MKPKYDSTDRRLKSKQNLPLGFEIRHGFLAVGVTEGHWKFLRMLEILSYLGAWL
jgi:hypothetical protein